MSDRQMILEAVQKMPDDASISEILDELHLLATVKERLAEIEAGNAKGFTREEVAAQVQQWISK
jgi:predicted transcriptional regulator